ncbi:rhomboid family intramembrane serine protease [bacterium]|nr:MAG: rhomboid family intramembrane serine protease [bacterium]
MRLTPVTKTLIAVNVLVFVAELLSGGTQQGAVVQLGVEYGPAIATGEWWRIVTAAFLHAGILHILFNMIALAQVGMVIELTFGAARMLLLYAVSLLAAGFSVLLFNYATPTLGASGAVFGLFGALLALGLRRGAAGRALVRQCLGIIVLNLVYGFAVAGISNAAHLGGLVAGFLLGLPLVPGAPARRVYAIDARESRDYTGQTIEQETGEPPYQDGPR